MSPADRSRLFRSFTSKWGHPDYPPDPESEETLAEAEEQLGVALPKAYRQFMREVGPFISSGDLLRAVTAAELDVAEVSEFHAARDIAPATLAWRRSKLPPELVTIASDGSGNQFCIRLSEPTRPAADAPVWIWRHESDTAEQVAASFAGWLSQLLQIERAGGG